MHQGQDQRGEMPGTIRSPVIVEAEVMKAWRTRQDWACSDTIEDKGFSRIDNSACRKKSRILLLTSIRKVDLCLNAIASRIKLTKPPGLLIVTGQHSLDSADGVLEYSPNVSISLHTIQLTSNVEQKSTPDHEETK